MSALILFWLAMAMPDDDSNVVICIDDRGGAPVEIPVIPDFGLPGGQG